MYIMYTPCTRKSLLNIGPISNRTVSIRLQSSRNCSTPTYCQSTTFGPLAFCVCPCFLRQKIKKDFASPQLRFLDAIFMRQVSGRCRHHRLLKTAHDFARLRTTTHNYAQWSIFIVLSIKLIFMVLGISHSRVLAQRLTGCCSASYHYDSTDRQCKQSDLVCRLLLRLSKLTPPLPLHVVLFYNIVWQI